ncbi:glycosyl hydrolase family 18 protein [Marinicrinis sediminis]|uniref:Glycosyl hydrolase family 18 protein n=1 Tax=Marinicrinis sediminis TaxID=1652465 RepID=A0ABW5RBU6_9BACL
MLKRIKLLLICTIAAVLVTGYFLMKPSPNTERVTVQWEKPTLFYQGEKWEDAIQGSAASLSISMAWLREHVDSYLHYEKESGTVVITTTGKVLNLQTEQWSARMNDQPIELAFPVQVKEDRVYIPVAPITELYQIKVEETESGAVHLYKQGDVHNWGQSAAEESDGTVPVRTEAGIQYPILYDLKPNEEVRLWNEKPEDGWYRVQTPNGLMGYMAEDDLRWTREEIVQATNGQADSSSDPPVVKKPLAEKVNLTWEHVYRTNPDTTQITPMPGVNVISPTWFSIGDYEGNLSNKADTAYVNWAHEQDYQVWALFSNDFTDPDKTSTVLAQHETRMKMIRQLVAFAELYKLDGINLDFENVYLKDRDLLTQFVRELTPMLHEQGLVVSMDVTVRSNSEMWSKFYDRRALSETLDYMIVMTYDEHWASSPKAGSVASIPWVERGIAGILTFDQVPPSKLILGIPLYTRVWTEEEVDGKVEVSSKAVGMETVLNTIREKELTPVYLDDVGQHYVEYEEDGSRKRIWMEDHRSIVNRIEMVKKYDLAGVATWRRGFETADIWPLIEEHLN